MKHIVDFAKMPAKVQAGFAGMLLGSVIEPGSDIPDWPKRERISLALSLLEFNQPIDFDPKVELLLTRFAREKVTE